MITYLKGKIFYKGSGFVVILVSDIGYKVFVNEKFFSKLESDQETEIYTHQYVREDSLDLYGFQSQEQLNLFELLLSISGIGPKSALNATSVADSEEFKDYIARGDSSLLTQVSGIGKRTAERVVVELRDRIGALPSGGVAGAGRGQEGSSARITQDEIDALISLGYSLTQARDALSRVDPEIRDSGQRIREALKNMENKE